MNRFNIFRPIAELIIRFRIAILIITALIVIGCASLIPSLGFNFTPQHLFQAKSIETKYSDAFAERFGREDAVVFIIFQTDKIFTPSFIKSLRNMTEDAGNLPLVKMAESISTIQIPHAGESMGMLNTKSVIPDTGEVTKEEVNELEKIIKSEPLVEGRLVSVDNTTTVLLVWIHPEHREVTEYQEVLDGLKDIVEKQNLSKDIKWEFGGVPNLRAEIVKSLIHQQLTFVPLNVIIYCLILVFLFRRFSGVILPLFVVFIAMLNTIALIVLTGTYINVINNVLFSLIFIIAVSDSIHMLARDAEGAAMGMGRAESVKNMIITTGSACFLTSATTAVGFFSLQSADTDILRTFGWQAGGSVIFGYIATLTFLPAALIYFKPVSRPSAHPHDGRNPWLENALEWLNDRTLAWPKLTVTLGILTGVVFFIIGSQVRVDTVMLEIYQKGHPIYESTQLLDRKLGGVLPVEISLESNKPNTFNDPENYKKINEIEKFAQKEDIVISTSSLIDYHQSARAALLGDPKQRDVMPDSSAQINQIQLLIAGAPDEKLGVRQFVTPNFQYARILLRVKDAGAKAEMKLAQHLKTKLAEVFPPESGVKFRLTGDAYIASLALDSFITDLFGSLVMALFIIVALLVVAFRSIRLGLISIIPNIIPLTITFGFMTLADIMLNTTTIIIFAIALGLAVDDTIHFLARFREEYGQHPTIHDTLIATIDGSGRAIVFTSLLFIFGLSVLLLSNFVPTVYFGLLLMITVFGAVLADLIILPPLLLLLYRNSYKQVDHPVKDSEEYVPK